MKAITKETETVGIESEKTVETLGEKTENVGVRTPVVVEKAETKRKVRVVKKIVKKKVIKKVPKRASVAPNCNDLEKVAIPNTNYNAPMEIEVSDRALVENNDSCRGESERSDLVNASLLGDQNRIELQDNEHEINMDVEEHEAHAEKSECDGVKGELSNDVNGEEGMNEHVEKRELVDSKPSDAVVNRETDDLKSQQGLSGEMASNWHMKGRTKIFIHGLDKETKEEDIRKVFEKVGEVVEVKIITNLNTGKSRGFGFIRFASADLAKLALKKFHIVEICGRTCQTAAIEGNDAILLNNIDKKWNSEHVLALLQKIGINNIDEVSVVADPENTELNRGFAFLEFETKRDAQMAYHKLQNKNIFGKQSKIKAAWAGSLVDPVEEDTHNGKSVYVEHIPLSWDEKEVKDHFIIYGEIESIALSKNLRSTKRNDFAFVNYKTCGAALSCIEALTCKQSTNNKGPKAHLKVSLTKSIPKGKPVQTISESATIEVSKFKQKTHSKNHTVYKQPYKPINMKMASIGRHEDGGSSTTAELVQLLREQASWKLGGPSSIAGMSTGHHQQPPSGGNQPFTEQGSKVLYHDPRAYHQTHLQIPNAAHPRPIANGVAMTSFPHYDQQRAHYTSGANPIPRYFQIRDQANYPGSNTIYRQMH